MKRSLLPCPNSELKLTINSGACLDEGLSTTTHSHLRNARLSLDKPLLDSPFVQDSERFETFGQYTDGYEKRALRPQAHHDSSRHSTYAV